MIVLLSPAKTLDETPVEVDFFSQPRLLDKSLSLIEILKKKNSKDLQKLMGVSEKIADLNVYRNQQFTTPFTIENAKPSVLAFKGDVYTGLQANEFNDEDLEFAQNHLRILSGLYGVLRPMDLMQPYRLEMGTKLKVKRKKNLYEYWDNTITEVLNEDLKSNENETIINLASNEYFKSVQKKGLEGDIINVHFKENRNGVYKVISFSAKKARGMMARYIVKNRIQNPKEILNFNEDRYEYSDELSSEKDWVFVR